MLPGYTCRNCSVDSNFNQNDIVWLILKLCWQLIWKQTIFFIYGKKTLDRILNYIIYYSKMYIKFDQICFWHLLRNFFPSPSSINICCCCYVTLVIFNSVRPYGPACQAPLSTGFSRQEYQRGLPSPFKGDLLNPGI